ncbi:hypothetical protein [Thiospirillum jenense]|nr:hypothetical protein [Thiospirillum jenense]
MSELIAMRRSIHWTRCAMGAGAEVMGSAPPIGNKPPRRSDQW